MLLVQILDEFLPRAVDNAEVCGSIPFKDRQCAEDHLLADEEFFKSALLGDLFFDRCALSRCFRQRKIRHQTSDRQLQKRTHFAVTNVTDSAVAFLAVPRVEVKSPTRKMMI